MADEYRKPYTPENPATAKKTNLTYPNVSGEYYKDGGHSVRYSSDEDNAHSENLNSDGSYNFNLREPSQKDGGITSTVNNRKYQTDIYGSAGLTLSKDSRTLGPNRDQSDAKSVATKNLYSRQSGQEIKGAGRGSAFGVLSSPSPEYAITGGDDSKNIEGNYHRSVEKNFVTETKGTTFEIHGDQVTKDVQSGSYEVLIKNGEAKIKSPTKITFEVGSSTIVMEPGKITITADRIDLNP